MNHGIRLARTGLVINGCLALVKLLAGVLGHSYALIADAVESVADIFSSLVVWSGLRISSRDADQRFPFGYGKAESVSSAIVGLMLVGAALGIAIEAIREILTPHHAPAPFTLAVLAVAVVIKEALFRRVLRTAAESGSQAVAADAWHHRADAISSAAAFVGISIALIGGPEGEPAGRGGPLPPPHVCDPPRRGVRRHLLRADRRSRVGVGRRLGGAPRLD